MSASEARVEDLAMFLKKRRDQGHRVSLLLGHRTGVLYRSSLYEMLKTSILAAAPFLKLLRQDRVHPDLLRVIDRLRRGDSISMSEKARTCHWILSRLMSDTGIYDILLEALKTLPAKGENELLAQLIKAEFFDTIITTNFDTSLEDACDLLELKNPNDYKLFICSSDEDDTRMIEQSSRCGQIIKVFGDITSRDYKIIGREFNWRPEIQQFLRLEMEKEMIILGYDQEWDGSLELLVQAKGTTLWYVSEEDLVSNTHLASVLNQRDGKLVRIAGSYHDFLQTLLDRVGGNVNWKPQVALPLPLATSQGPVRKKVFICYSHEDKQYMEACRKHLLGFLNADIEKGYMNVEDIWVDTDIRLGDLWEQEVKKAIHQTQLALVLSSSDFWTSKFIQDTELPMLLAAAEANLLRIIPVRLRPGRFVGTELAKYQGPGGEEEILSGLDTYVQELFWVRLAEKVMDLVKHKMN